MTKDTEYWKGVFKEASEQLDALTVRRDRLDIEREEVNMRIAQLEQLIANLTPFTSETPREKIDAFLIENATEMGLADAVREIMKQSNKFMTPIDIRDALVASEYDLEPYSNPLASIHGILKRFEDSGEAGTVSLGNKTAYRIATPRRRFAVPHPGKTIITEDVRSGPDPGIARGTSILEKTRLTEAAHAIFNHYNPMTPGDIREKLEALGFNVKEDSDFQTIFDAIRKRIYVMKQTSKDGKITYRLMTDEENQRRRREEAIQKRKLRMENP